MGPTEQTTATKFVVIVGKDRSLLWSPAWRSLPPFPAGCHSADFPRHSIAHTRWAAHAGGQHRPGACPQHPSPRRGGVPPPPHHHHHRLNRTPPRQPAPLWPFPKKMEATPHLTGGRGTAQRTTVSPMYPRRAWGGPCRGRFVFGLRAPLCQRASLGPKWGGVKRNAGKPNFWIFGGIF